MRRLWCRVRSGDLLTLEDISLGRKGQELIHPVSLVFEPGSVNVLLGRALAGKTTLLRLMAGLERPTHGRVFDSGVDVTQWSVRRRDIAMVYQQFVNYPGLTVRENIASPLRVRGAPVETIRQEVERVASLLKIGDYLDRLPLELSGGQQQRVALARALIKKAKLVLLDEPLANLDFKLREELREEIPRLFSGTDAILVYATTDPVEALLLGGRTIVLHEGRVLQSGPASEVYARPDTLACMQVFSDPPLNVLEAGQSSGEAIGFRAHHLRPGPAEGPEIGFDAIVSGTEITGSETFVHLRSGGHAWVMLRRGVEDYAAQSTIQVRVHPRDTIRFDASGARVAASAGHS